ncbi:MAG: aspartate kinase, partial [Raoultibacter sp.]
MALIVAKFGGTSVASPDRIQMVAKRLIASKQAGNQVVAVVSAMGKTTDELLGLARALSDDPPAREMDMLLSTGEQVSMSLLAMSIQARGYKAASFTGWQAGIETDCNYSRAKIEHIETQRIKEALDRGAIAVVAGFQGLSSAGDITTLGRGGSDTTAVALAWGLQADVCE